MKNTLFVFTSIIILIVIFFIAASFYFFPNDNNPSASGENTKNIVNTVSRYYKNLDYLNINTRIVFDEDDNKTVAQTLKSYKKDEFSVKFSASYIKNELQNEDFLKKVTSHELGHIVLMQNNQVSTFLSESEINSEISLEKQIQYENSFIDSYFSNNIGCYGVNSYINLFKKTYWNGEMLTEYNKISREYTNEHNVFNEKISQWYEKYKINFISVQASQNIEEDFAESFSAYIMGYKINDANISKKIEFFSNFEYFEKIKNDFNS